MRYYQVGETGAIYTEENEPARNLGRLVAVIDPEDIGQIGRLADIFCERPSRGWIDAMQDALREYADPRLPEPEPTDLAVRVVAANGTEWARRNASGSDGDGGLEGRWGCLNGSYFDRSWDDLLSALGPVKVLSEGVK